MSEIKTLEEYFNHPQATPLSKRVFIAEELLKEGCIETPEQYFKILNSKLFEKK